jgi:hypothetical protein
MELMLKKHMIEYLYKSNRNTSDQHGFVSKKSFKTKNLAQLNFLGEWIQMQGMALSNIIFNQYMLAIKPQ